MKKPTILGMSYEDYQNWKYQKLAEALGKLTEKEAEIAEAAVKLYRLNLHIKQIK